MIPKEKYSIQDFLKYQPFLSDRVDDPWQSFPDSEDFNADAFQSLEYEIEMVVRDEKRQSHGCLILGEAGTGKTHLLMRVVKYLSKSNYVMFIRRVNNADTVTQYIWSSMIQSLVKPLPDIEFGERCQLIAFLTHVFSAILKDEALKKVNEGKKSYQEILDVIKDDPFKIPEIIKDDKFRGRINNLIRNRVKNDLPEADLSFVDAFFKYFYLKEKNRLLEIRSWLEGQIDDPEILEKIGLPSWVRDDQTPNYLAVKEEKAERGIHTLSLLSKYYPYPLIVCFDQLEGLRGQPEIVNRFADVVREIFTRCNNFLVVTCIFPSLWKEFESYVDRSYLDRAGQSRINLEDLTIGSAKNIIQKRLAPFHTDLDIESSTAIDPFEELDIPVLLYEDKNDITTVFPIRQFIARCREAWKQWILNKIPKELQHSYALAISSNSGTDAQQQYDANSPELNRDVSFTEIDIFIKDQILGGREIHSDTYLLEVPNEESLFYEILEILSFLIARSSADIKPLDKIPRYKLVMPIYQQFECNSSDVFCLAILNKIKAPFTYRIENFKNNCISGQFTESILIRDVRTGEFPNRGKGGEQLGEYAKYGHPLLLIEDDLIIIRSIYSSIEDIRNHNWQIRNYTVNLDDLYRWIVQSQFLMNSELFRQVDNTLFGSLLFTDAEPSSHDHRNHQPSPTRIRSGQGITREIPEFIKPRDSLIPSPAISMTEITKITLQTGKFRIDTDFLLGTTNPSSIRLGWLGRRVTKDKNDMQRVALSLTKPRNVALFGYMGSGKSYGLATIIENALLSPPHCISQADKPLSVVAFNYRQNAEARIEYPSYIFPNTQSNAVNKLKTMYGLTPTSISRINFIAYEKELPKRQTEYKDNSSFSLKFKPMELDMKDWLILLRPPKVDTEYMDVMKDILAQLYYEDKLTMESIEITIEVMERLEKAQKRRALNRLKFAEKYIDMNRNYEWDDVIQPGVLTVFDLRAALIDKEQALKLVLVISNIIRRNVKNVNKLIVFDEAHEYMGEKLLTSDLDNMLTQIRHDGLSFVLASQFPEHIPQKLFRFFNTNFLFQIPNKKSFEYLKTQIPDMASLTAQSLNLLPKNKGRCYLITSTDVSDPRLKMTLFEFRPRMTLHGGETIQNIE